MRLQGDDVARMLSRLVDLSGAPNRLYADSGADIYRPDRRCLGLQARRSGWTSRFKAYPDRQRPHRGIQRIAQGRVPERELVCFAG